MRVIKINKGLYSDCGKKDYNMEQIEYDLVEQAARLNTQEEYFAWKQRIHRMTG